MLTSFQILSCELNRIDQGSTGCKMSQMLIDILPLLVVETDRTWLEKNPD